MAAAVSLVAWWRAATDWTHLYPYRLEAPAKCRQILGDAGVLARVSRNQDAVEVDRTDIPRARAILAGRRLPKTSWSYLDEPLPIELEALRQELRDSVCSVAGVRDAEIYITYPAEKGFAEPQDPPSVRIALRRNGPVDLDSVRHLAACTVPRILSSRVMISEM